jgi:hypothetical protein
MAGWLPVFRAAKPEKGLDRRHSIRNLSGLFYFRPNSSSIPALGCWSGIQLDAGPH